MDINMYCKTISNLSSNTYSLDLYLQIANIINKYIFVILHILKIKWSSLFNIRHQNSSKWWKYKVIWAVFLRILFCCKNVFSWYMTVLQLAEPLIINTIKSWNSVLINIYKCLYRTTFSILLQLKSSWYIFLPARCQTEIYKILLFLSVKILPCCFKQEPLKCRLRYCHIQ